MTIRHPPAAAPCAADLDAMIACLDAESRNVTLIISQALVRGAYIQAWRLPFLLFGFFDSGRHTDEAVAAADLARRYAAEAIDLARSSANPEALARASVHLAGCLRSGDPPAAQSLLHQAASIARRLGTTDLEIAIWCVRALLAMDAGATDSAFTLLDQAAELSRATRNVRGKPACSAAWDSPICEPATRAPRPAAWPWPVASAACRTRSQPTAS